MQDHHHHHRQQPYQYGGQDGHHQSASHSQPAARPLPSPHSPSSSSSAQDDVHSSYPPLSSTTTTTTSSSYHTPTSADMPIAAGSTATLLPLGRTETLQSDATAFDNSEKPHALTTNNNKIIDHIASYDYMNNEKSRDSIDELPPAVPRYPNGRGSFMPGHVSRGSVALQAAAEGKIPKKEGLKMWRADEHHGVFGQGGRAKACLRCTICTLIFGIIVFAGIVAAFLLWVRPPNVQFRGVQAPSVSMTSSGFGLNLTLDISVSNPNFFGASFKRIEAKAYYPSNTASAIGGGALDNVKIPAHSQSTLYFPFNINYTKAIDPNSLILQDIATKCGFIGDTKSNIRVNYDLALSVNLVIFRISPTFSSSTSFPCPLSQSDIQGLTRGTDLGRLLTGGVAVG